MMRFSFVLFAIGLCALTTGCDTARVNELSKEVMQLRDENKKLQEELDKVKQQVVQTEAIRKGYEEARAKFEQQLAGLKSVLGANVTNPLPPFEGLQNSDWVGKLMPGAAEGLGNAKDLKEAQELLKGILGGQNNKGL